MTVDEKERVVSSVMGELWREVAAVFVLSLGTDMYRSISDVIGTIILPCLNAYVHESEEISRVFNGGYEHIIRGKLGPRCPRA